MNTRKHIVKISYGFIAALMIVLVGFLIYRQRQIRQMSQNEGQAPDREQAPLAAVTQGPLDTQISPEAMGGAEQLAAEADTLRYQLEASEEELDMAREDLAKAEGQGIDTNKIIAMNKKMQENSTLRNMMRRDMANTIGQRYGALFEKLGLSNEKIEAFKTLMVDYQMQDEEVSMGLMEQSLSEEERKEIMQQIGDLDARFDKQVEDLLGTQDYGAYEAYEERTRERSYVSGAFESLSADLGLSDEKEEALIDAMYEARKGVETGFESDPKYVSETGGLDLNPGNVVEWRKAILDGYIESARSVLSESQAEEFETRINEEKEMMKMSGKLTPPRPGT